MKGILEKTTRGWVIKKIEYGSDEAKFITTYPLHESDVNNFDEAVRLGEHGEVDFELVMGIDSIFNTTKPFAKIWYPMLEKLKEHLGSITPEQFHKEIEEIQRGFVCTTENCPHCAYERQQEYEADLEKEAAIDFAKWLAQDWMSVWVVDKWMWENVDGLSPKNYNHNGMYYTEEELYSLYLKQS